MLRIPCAATPRRRRSEESSFAAATEAVKTAVDEADMEGIVNGTSERDGNVVDAISSSLPMDWLNFFPRLDLGEGIIVKKNPCICAI